MSNARECRLELLLGKRVVDADGAAMGRLEEVVAELVDGEYVVREFHVGKLAVLERLGGGLLLRDLLRLVGGKRIQRGYVVPWEVMDLTNPEQPRVTVPVRELPEPRDRKESPAPAPGAA